MNTDTGLESGRSEGPPLSVLDSLLGMDKTSPVALMLLRLTRLRPAWNSKRLWPNATAAEESGEVGVTDPQYIEPGDLRGLHFMDKVVFDLAKLDWSLCVEVDEHGTAGISIWRVRE